MGACVDRILIALDTSTADEALSLAETLRGTVGGFKIGHQLFTAAGPEMVRTLVAQGDRIFLDLKYHDIPNTVAGAIQSAAALGVWMVNVHASGGAAMLQAARTAADRAADRQGRSPLLIAVTVLTSLDAAALESIGIDKSPLEHAKRLAELAHRMGCDGVVASPQETAAIRQACGTDFLVVTPGIRGGAASMTDAGAGFPPSREALRRDLDEARRAESGSRPDSRPDDQMRTMTPADAIRAGSSYLVIGRPITAAPNPREAARRIADELAISR
jgi:orotidine-5'-phosphate decarboxylase